MLPTTRATVELQRIKPRWLECVVAATGPSLTEAVAQRCQGLRVLAVNDAYRLMPFAEVLYCCDAEWWHLHQGCPGFLGEKWSSHSVRPLPENDKATTAEKYGLRLVAGRDGEGFSMDPGVIHYGSTSGFQAINLALLMGAKRVLLVGFDMHSRNGRHFFGDHPAPLVNALRYEGTVPEFRRAAESLPPGIEIINCTPGSALDCFPMVSLEDAL